MKKTKSEPVLCIDCNMPLSKEEHECKANEFRHVQICEECFDSYVNVDEFLQAHPIPKANKTLAKYFQEDVKSHFGSHYILDRGDESDTFLDLQSKINMIGKGALTNEHHFMKIAEKYDGKIYGLEINKDDDFYCYVYSQDEDIPEGHRMFEHYNLVIRYPEGTKATSENLKIILNMISEIDSQITEILEEKIEKMQELAEKKGLDLDIELHEGD